jgi:AAA+ superfamily predicted ATPase
MSESPTTRTVDAITAYVRACARLRTAWMERLWSEGATSPDQGLAIQHGEVCRILETPETAKERYSKFLGEDDSIQLANDVAAAGDQLANNAFWHGIVQIFGLTPHESELLLLCIAVELAPELARVLAYLADDTRATQPTSAAAATLFGWQDGAVSMTSNLTTWRLARPAQGELSPLSATVWHADEAVVLSVQCERWVDPALNRCASFTSPDNANLLPCLYPDLLSQMLTDYSHGKVDDGGRDPEVVLIGPAGSGRQVLAAQVAAAIGSHLFTVKTPLLASAQTRLEWKLEAMIQAARMAHVTGAVLYWRDADAVTETEWLEMRRLLGLRMMRGVTLAPATATHRYSLPPLSTARRVEVWAHYSMENPPAIVRAQRLTVSEIRQLAQSPGDDPASLSLRWSIQSSADLIQPLQCPYTWDDLVVSPNLDRLLKDFEAQVQLRWEVYEGWGFSRLTHLGQGISALFGGPSGTGKTMAAQVIARSLGMALYRVDLAGVVNKYIGETEKRLREVFDSCERSGALLFFDEADALFGNRMQVKDSHDRFANIEIDYLLQRIEQFDGIAILATNRKNDLDSAFLRRLRFVIDFLNPDLQERQILWEKSLPLYAPSGERVVDEIDYNFLAEEMELNGAQIKSIALGAAFLARSAGKLIGMDEIELSAHREYAKQGQLLRASLTRRSAAIPAGRLANG